MSKILSIDYTIRCTMRLPLGEDAEAEFIKDPEAVRQLIAEGLLQGAKEMVERTMVLDVRGVDVEMPKVVEL